MEIGIDPEEEDEYQRILMYYAIADIRENYFLALISKTSLLKFDPIKNISLLELAFKKERLSNKFLKKFPQCLE